MCGIAGIFSFNLETVDPAAALSMGRAIRHRGPDEEGVYSDRGVAMVIERLKVIDLVTGSQPIHNETRDISTVFNGEIYNYKELRRELEAKGHRFSTQSDTETIVHAYEEYGEEFPKRLNGMFAIAIWDRKKRKLILARDRAGIKPLFYGVHQGKLYFASEIKGILNEPAFSREIDPEAFLNYLSFYYISAPHTIYRHIRRLPAGSILTAMDGKMEIKRWWDLHFNAKPGSSGDYENEFRSTLEASVARHLQSDVPVGVFLSGGIDSASLVCAASKRMGRIKTYSIGYKERSFSELEEAALIARHFNTDHHEYTLSAADLPELLPQVIRQHDEPHGDWSHVPNYILSREAKKEVTVVLTGTGGDELFGGYPTYFAARAASAWKLLPAPMRKAAAPILAAIPVSFERMPLRFLLESFLRGADAPMEEAHRRFKEIFSEAERSRILSSWAQGLASSKTPEAVFTQYQDQYRVMSPVDRLMYLDFKVFMAHCALTVNDITSSAHAVEARVPFLDAEMISLAERIPWNQKIHGLTTKKIMRRAMARELPPEIVRMKKKGFLIPGAPWLKEELRPFLLETLRRAERDLKEVFDFGQIRWMLNEHFQQRGDHTRRIFCLFSFFLWHENARPSWKNISKTEIKI